MAKLDFDRLWRVHPTNVSDQLPCRLDSGFPTFANQCAVRVGVCLREGGVLPGQLSGLIHCGVHPVEQMHFIRAEQFANRLVSAAASIEGLGPVEKITGPDAANYANILFGRRGLIFLKDYWSRAGESARGNATGDHIDLWNGYRTTASWLMEYFAWLGYYGGYDKSREVWFWPIDD
ncbi:MAG: hypothetical protein GC150_13205 [Rhizobiales bacterium]|nr:hypothetical protein [Hyphomicrobiales bacterium]